MAAIRLAFLGFRHSHVLAFYAEAQRHPSIRIVAACETDASAREAAGLTELLDNVDAFWDAADAADAVVVGDVYDRRGGMVIDALLRGKHVISDKPLCTRLGELEVIRSLAAERGRTVSCLLGNPFRPSFHTMAGLIADGCIGEPHQVMFSGQHPLLYGTRPDWYFEVGRHGGTINDIAIHATHMVPWLTGQPIVEVVAARTWNAFATDVPHFEDAGQLMLRLGNDAGAIGDVSYAMPDDHGYTLPQYWRVTVFGSGGVVEASQRSDHVFLARQRNANPEYIPIKPPTRGLLDHWLGYVATGEGAPLDTASVLEASRVALIAQQLADRKGSAVLSLASHARACM